MIIPDTNSKTFLKVIDALGGDDYAYYVFDVKHVEDKDSNKKIQIALKVHVPQSERMRATENIQNALMSDGLNVVRGTTKEPNKAQLDVYFPNRDNKQLIRIEIKPENSSGSGGGAAATKIQECGQCLYAAMKMYCFPNVQLVNGDRQFFTDDHYATAASHCDIPGVKVDEIKALPMEWKESFMIGANKINEILSGNDYEFVRGDSKIDDGAIKNAFNRVKDQAKPKLASEDKWNPADIWVVKKSKKADVINKLNAEQTINGLNQLLQELTASKELIGISLKKSDASAKLVLKNSEPAAVRKKNSSVSFEKQKTVSGVIFDNGKQMKDEDKKFPMDVYFYHGTGMYDRFQARNFGGQTKGDWKLELKGRLAAQGKVQGSIVYDLMSEIGCNNLPSIADWSKCSPTASKSTRDLITKEIYDLLSEFDATGFSKAKKDTNNMISLINMRPQSWRYSKLSGLRLLKWIKSNTNKADDVMKELYMYASSQSDYSSVYYKLS
jgi:hypothetical protein